MTMQKFKKGMVATALAVALFGSVNGVAVASGIPVFDGAAAANFMQQFLRMKEQLDTAKSQLTEAQRMYESVTGVRGFGDLMRNNDIRRFLPDDVGQIYDAVNSGNYEDISGSVDDIMRSEQVSGSMEDAKWKVLEREKKTAATDKAVGKKGYEGARKRLDQIDKLMDEISQTQDQKAIDELQARISGEQAAIQNEMNKLAMLSQLQATEERLVQQQKREISNKILSSENTGMAKIQ